MTSPVRRADPDAGSGADWRERLALRNWSLPVKLAAVLLVPTIFVISLGVLRIVEQTDKAGSYDGVQQAVALESGTADLLAALDTERAAAAVFLAGRAGGPQSVQPRIDASTRAANELRQASLGADGLDDQTRDAYRQAATELTQLDRTRSDVIAARIDASAAISRYTEATSALLTFDESLTREAADPSVAGLSTGLYSLSVVREQDAYLRAVVAAGIAAGRIDAPSIDGARNATLRRSIAVDDFRNAVGPAEARLADGVVGADVDQRDLLAQVVLGRGSAGLPLQVAGPDWDRASTVVEDRVADVSTQLRRQLQDNAAALQEGARNAAGVASVVLLLALMAGAAVVYFVTRSLLRPLRLLRRTALDVAERRLPGAVKSLREGEVPDTTIVPTPINTREEIGQVARAFDQVHEQAVRLAAEQAGLRSAFNSIFVNLSRRSQALVERQLRLIEQLENNEEDPEALSDLFQLDHLATRMRRNSENLLVLAGTDLSRRNSRPVPLVDVLRAAASEVEQYQRVDLAPPPAVMLLGRTASDVVHLVAELLENATTFSAPETRVDISASQRTDGAVVLEIADRGVGMTDEDLDEANSRLDAPPTVDVSASRRMGLFVVGRLAIRHGIDVTLRTREEGGVVAGVVVPSSAILAAAPTEATPGVLEGTRSGGSGLPVRAPGTSGAARAGGIPRQEPRETPAGLPRRGGEPPARPAASGGTSFFAPAVEPGRNGHAVPTPEEPRTGGTPAPRNGLDAGAAGLAGGLAAGAALPRRPQRDDAPGGPTDGAPPSGPGDEGPHDAVPRDDTEAWDAQAWADDEAADDGDWDDDDRTASVPGDDDGVTLWRVGGEDEAPHDADGPPTGGVPTRAVAAHAWHDDGDDEAGADDETRVDDGAEPGAVEAPTGRHGMRRPPQGPAPQGWPGAQPGSGQQGPGQQGPGQQGPSQRGFGPGQQQGPGQHQGPGQQGAPGRPWGPPPPPGAPPGWRPGPPPSHPGMPAAAPGQGPAGWSGPPRPPVGPTPPPLWNGAEVVPPPGPQAAPPSDQGADDEAVDPTGAQPAVSDDEQVEPTAVDDGTAVDGTVLADDPTAGEPDVAAPDDETITATTGTEQQPADVAETPDRADGPAGPGDGSGRRTALGATGGLAVGGIAAGLAGGLPRRLRPTTSAPAGEAGATVGEGAGRQEVVAGPADEGRDDTVTPAASGTGSHEADGTDRDADSAPRQDGPGEPADAGTTGTVTDAGTTGTVTDAGDGGVPSATEDDADPQQPAASARPSLPMRPLARRRGPGSGPLLVPGQAPRLRPRRPSGEEPDAATADGSTPGEGTTPAGAPGPAPFAPATASDAPQTPVGQTPVGQTPVGQTPAGQTPAGSSADEGLFADDTGTTHPAADPVAGSADGPTAPARGGRPGTGAFGGIRTRGAGGYAAARPADGDPETLAGAGTNGVGTNGVGTNGVGTNGVGTNGAGTNGVGTGANGTGTNGTGRAVPERLPMRPPPITREPTPIFDEVASVWFREAPPSGAGAEDADWSSTGGDAGWQAAASSTEAVDDGLTEAGLPRRRPKAQLVPGSARPARPPGPGAPAEGPALPRRNADAVRGRLASYQRGVSDGRSTRLGRTPDTAGAGQDGPTDAREQEEQ